MERNQLQYHTSRMSAVTKLGASPTLAVGTFERVDLRTLIGLCRLIFLAEHLAAQVDKHFINIG